MCGSGNICARDVSIEKQGVSLIIINYYVSEIGGQAPGAGNTQMPSDLDRSVPVESRISRADTSTAK